MTDVTTDGVPSPGHDRTEPVDIQFEMQRSYIDYAMSVIVGRALPDVRDGLKPVHTRVLYAMYDGGYRPDRGYSKCSRVVGDVMGQYHPHGDSAIYDALVRLGQDWSMRYPLIDSQGNFGSPGNDPPAAMRYTECRLAPLAMEMLRDIDKETVDFHPNYDGRSAEPVVLPARFPNLLVNGSEGIAVGMATKIPPHNLREVAAGVRWYLDNFDSSDEDLLGNKTLVSSTLAAENSKGNLRSSLGRSYSGAKFISKLQKLLRYICEQGFEHHVAANFSQTASAVYEAAIRYLGWDMYYHNEPEA